MPYGPICYLYQNKQLYGSLQQFYSKQDKEIQLLLVDLDLEKIMQKRFTSVCCTTETQT